MTTTRRLPPTVVLALCALMLPSCAYLQQLLGPLPKPSASITGVRITDFSLNDLTLTFDVAVSNPYAVPLPLVSIDYALASAARPFLQGQAPLQGTIPAQGTQTVSLPAKVVFAELLKLLDSARPGALVPYHGTLGLSVNAPMLGLLRLPLEKDGQFPVPTPPVVSIAQVKWQNVSLAGATGVLGLRVANPNSFAFEIASLTYQVRLGNFDLAKGALTHAANLAAGAAQEIGISVSVATAQAGLGIVQLLSGQSSHYDLGGALVIGTPFGPLRIPLAVAGQVPFLH